MIEKILYDLVILSTPVAALSYTFRDLRKALLVYFFFIVTVFALKYKMLEALPSSTIYIIFSSLTIIYAVHHFLKTCKKYNRENILSMLKSSWNLIRDLIVILALCFASLYIPINQNWDFYTFYLQVIYNSSFKSIVSLFSNVMLMHLIIVKDLDVLPRSIAIFYMVMFYLLLVCLIGKYPSLLVIFLPSIFTVFLHENLYLELSSLTLLALVLSFMKENLRSPLLMLASTLLLFTKANFIVLGLSILSYLTFYHIYHRNYKLLVTLGAPLLAVLFYISNAFTYDAYNFEYIPLFNDLAARMGNSTLSSFWLQTVSGTHRVIPIYVSMIDVIINLASPVYQLYILPLLVYLLTNLIHSISYRIQKFSISIAIEISNISRFHKLYFQKFLAMACLITWLIYSFGRSYIDINVYQNIFVIRYYVPIIFVVYVILISLININENSQEFFKMLVAVTIFFYTYLFATQGYFMKEKILLCYNNFRSFALMHIFSLIIFSVAISILLKNKRKNNILNKMISIIYLSSMITLIIAIVFLIFMIHLNLRSNSVNVDSTEYFPVLASALPQYYTSYFVSYSDNDRIIYIIGNKCPVIYSFGGIYSIDVYKSNKIINRGGHFSYLPFILADFRLSNPSEYQKFVSRYPYLKEFELPSIFCLQIPTENHAEKSILAGIEVLKQNSPSFSRVISKIEADKPILETKFYKIYFIKTGD